MVDRQLELLYFSSVTEYTHKFLMTVTTLMEESGDQSPIMRRIPIKGTQHDHPEGPAVLVTPSYIGSTLAKDMPHVPVQVLRYMKGLGPKRSLIWAVVGMGNTNFGQDYCAAGSELAAKLGVPLLGRYELAGLPGDHERFIERYRKFCRVAAGSG